MSKLYEMLEFDDHERKLDEHGETKQVYPTK